MFYINLHDIINSIDSTLEKAVNSYNNSFADNFIDELKNHLITSELTEKLKNIPNNTLFTLDRFESDFAVCENRTTGEMFNIPKFMIHPSAREGNILKFGNGKFRVNLEETSKQSTIIQNLFKKTTKSIKIK